MAITLDGTAGTTTPALTNSALTSGRVTYAGTSGVLQDSANLTFDGTNVTSAGTVTGTKLIPTGGAATGNGMYLPAANSLGFTTAGTERVQINNSASPPRYYFYSAGSATTLGDCIFNFAGTFNANRGISVNGTDSAAAGDMIVFALQGTTKGTISAATGGTTYGTTSDYRLKENVKPIQNALSKVALLKPCTYTWKQDGSAGEGFIAHELQEIVPQAVVGEKDAVDKDGNINPQNIDTSFLVATLTAAIQELTARVAALEAK